MENNILPITEIREFLKTKSIYSVSRETGISYPTVKKLIESENNNFNTRTLKIISDYINYAQL